MFREDQQIGDYTLIKQLGEGGFGQVWLARNQNNPSSPHVAIKFPKSENVDWQAIVQEIGLWVLCGEHSNVLPFIEARNYNGQIAIISEYAPDGSLRDLLERQGTLPIKQVVEMITGVLDGLAHLHSSGIIHRDLKPENILLQGNAPRLADFGISRVITVNAYSNTISGTPWYMAPESFSGKRTVQTDVWAVGVILYESLEGKLPFPQRMRQELHEAISTRQPEPLSQAIPLKLQEIILKALAKQPEARYQTSAEMRQELYNFWQFIYKQEIIPTIEQTPPFVKSESISIIEPNIQIIEPEVISAIEKVTQTKESEIAVENIQLIPYRKGDTWGFCDERKRIIVKPKYKAVGKFREGLAWADVNGKRGFVEQTGNEIILPKYDDAFSFFEGLAAVQLNNKWGVIDKTGREVVPFKYDRIWGFHEGFASVRLGGRDWLGTGGKRGFIDRTGREITPIKYDRVLDFRYGVAWVQLNYHWGLIDKTGHEIVPPKYVLSDVEDPKFCDGLTRVCLDGRYGFVDRTGRVVIPPEFETVGEFNDGLAWVKFNGKYFYIDNKGNEAIPFKYEDAKDFHEGLAETRKLNKKWGGFIIKSSHAFIDRSGREVIPIAYDDVKYFNEGMAIVVANRKYGFINKFGMEVIPTIYDGVQPFKEGLARVKLKDKYGYIDMHGQEAVPVKYDNTSSFNEGLAEVNLNGKWRGYIGRDGMEYFED